MDESILPQAESRFDCELPDDVLDELIAPKRAKMLSRPEKGPHRWRLIILAVLALVLVAAGVMIALWSWQRPSVMPPVQSAASPQPTPSAEPVQPPVAVEHVIEQPILPPRAQLMKLPTPKAQLVRLPTPRMDLFTIAPEHIDESHDITMPYGTVVRATLRGFLENENQLPRVGHIGDMYVVANTPWIWLVAPGTTVPQWIDP